MLIALCPIKPLCWNIQVWDDSGNLVRGVVGLSNRTDFEEVVRQTISGAPPNWNLEHYFRLDPSLLSHFLPGIHKKVKNPVSGKEDEDLFEVIISLNDDHSWTRKQIAEWIETFDDIPKFEV